MGIFSRSTDKQVARDVDQLLEKMDRLSAYLPETLADGSTVDRVGLRVAAKTVLTWSMSELLTADPGTANAELAEDLARSLNQYVMRCTPKYHESTTLEVRAEDAFALMSRAVQLRAALEQRDLTSVLDAFTTITVFWHTALMSTPDGSTIAGLLPVVARRHETGDESILYIPVKGWYLDPGGSGRFRESDGTRWTENFNDIHPDPLIL